MRKLLVLSGIAACAASANAIIIIDDFTTGTGFSDGLGVVGSKVTVSQPGGMMGGERDVRLEVASVGGFGQMLKFEVGTGFTVTSTGAGVDGKTELQYDLAGDETPGSPFFSGTQGATVNFAPETAFRVRFLFNDLPLNMTLTADLGGLTWSATTLVGGGISSPTDVIVPFASMLGPGAFPGLTSRLTVSFDTSTAGDFAVGEIAAVPEPASMTALVLGLGALAARRRRK